MAIQKIDEALCIGCEICIEDCPTDVIRLSKERKAYIAYLEDCIVCFQCTTNCPADAISVSSLPARELILPY